MVYAVKSSISPFLNIHASITQQRISIVSAKFADGTAVVKGKRVAALTNAGEDAVGLIDELPFLLETRLRNLGADVVLTPIFYLF